METHIPDISSQSSKRENGLNKTLFGIGGIMMGLVLLLIVLLICNYFNILSLATVFPKQLGFLPHKPIIANESAGANVNATDQNAAIAKVGEESIYQQDLDTELADYPANNTPDTRKLLLKKIAKDSIILQAGQKEGLIQLDSSVFNSSQKDYSKRLALVSQVQNQIENRQDSITGNVVAIWFFNDKAGAVGYDNGKSIAQNTITPLYNDVKDKKITMQQAAQQIQNNTSLAQVDTQYKDNAIFTFKAGPSDTISFDPTFDAMIHKLQPGEITPLYLAKDKNIATGQMIDAVYMFAQVSGKTANGHSENFDQWYAQVQKNYEITFY